MLLNTFKVHVVFQHAKGQKLEEIHCVQRVRFCDWWLVQPVELPQCLFVSDEKYFQLEEAPNPKNTGTWSKTNPHIIEGVKCQSSVKVLCFVVIIDGRILEPIWIDRDPKTKKCSVDAKVYKKMLIKILNQFTQEELDKYWWMQGI